MSDIVEKTSSGNAENVGTSTPANNSHNEHKKISRIALRPALIIFFSMLGIIVCLSAAVIILAVQVGKDSAADETEPVKEAFVPIVNERVYDFYDEDEVILFDDPSYGQIWIPAFSNVPKHTYDYSGLVLENGRYTYSENGTVISRTGIDVSYHQGDIDWQRVAEDGIDFAIIRVGYRGYESGIINLDDHFHEYARGALDAGLDVGAYFFSQALDTDEAIEEANFVMEQIHDYDIEFPIVFDWEIMESEDSRTSDAPPYTVTECAAAFCDTISDGGYIPMFYGSRKFALMKMDVSRLSGFDFWFAEYKDGHNEPSYPYDFQMWQYASDGIVDGINGYVDMNICFADYGRTREIGNDEQTE